MDALEAKNRLIAAGVSPEQAEAHARAGEQQSRTAALDEIAKHAAGKSDFDAFRVQMREDLNASDKKVDVGFAELRAEMRMMKWMLGVGAAVIVAAIKGWI